MFASREPRAQLREEHDTMYTKDLAKTYEEFEKTMIQQSFAFVQLPCTIGTDVPSTVRGQYGSGAMGTIQFRSHLIQWIERFVQIVLLPGSRVVQRLDPYCLHDGKPVHGILALYVPKSRASAIMVKDIEMPPPSYDPSCGIVFVTQRGYPVELGDGWCISFDLAINDYELDCVTRLQCLLQGMCPRLPDQLDLALNSTRLDRDKAKCFEMVLNCRSATRHPRSLTLPEAISLVTFCARRRSGKRVRFSEQSDVVTTSSVLPSPPSTPTGIPAKELKTSHLPLLLRVPSPEFDAHHVPSPVDAPHFERHSSTSTTKSGSQPSNDAVNSEALDFHLLGDPIENWKECESRLSPMTSLPADEQPHDILICPSTVPNPSLPPLTRPVSNSEPATLSSPPAPSTETRSNLPKESETQTADVRSLETPQLANPIENPREPESTPLCIDDQSLDTTECIATVQEQSAPASKKEAWSSEPIQLYSPLSPSPTMSPSLAEAELPVIESTTPVMSTDHGSDENAQQELSEEDYEMEVHDEQREFETEEYTKYLDDGVHTPLPLDISRVCPPELDSCDRVLESPSPHPDIEQQVQSICSLQTPLSSTTQSISRRYCTLRWYEYAYGIDSVLAYKKFQATVDDDHPVKLAYAFHGINESLMPSMYPCVVTLAKLGRWSRETFEVFGATTLRKAIELVLRIHTKKASKCDDVYVAMTCDERGTNIPLDVPLDDGIPVEEVVLRRYPKGTFESMRQNTNEVYAWKPGGIFYVTSNKSEEQQRQKRQMTGLGIPKRHNGHQPPVCCSTDADCYKKLYAQPKTLVIPPALRQTLRQSVPCLKSVAYNRRRKESDYFPSSIASSGDWLADHHLEIHSSVSRFIRRGGKSGCDHFPLQCELFSKRCSELLTKSEAQLTLDEFLEYYLELIELISRSGTLLGDAIFFARQHKRTADFIADVVFSRAKSLAHLFKETDNKDDCLWISRTEL